MAAFVSVEEYLSTSYEPDVEYVDGVVEERSMGEDQHAAWQITIGSFFFTRSHKWNIRVRPELRTKTGERRYRIPDIAIREADIPVEPVAITPPLIAFEILSPEDRIARLLIRLADFEVMGVPAIYVIDPQDGALFRFQGGKLGADTAILLREKAINWSEIAATLC